MMKRGEKSVYSWKLVDTDRVPSGKRCTESLRSIEKRIRRDLEDGIHTHEADRTTLNGHFDRYIAQKIEIKESTRGNYKYMYDKYVRDEIGYMKLANIKYSDIKRFYLSLIHEKGFKPQQYGNHPYHTSSGFLYCSSGWHHSIESD